MNDDLDMNQNVNPNGTIASMTAGPFSRRRLLAGAGILGAALVAAACGSDDKDTATTTGATTAPSTGATTAPTEAGTDTTMGGTDTTMGGTDTTAAGADDGSATDLAIVNLAAGLEVLAVGTYAAALEAATAGALGEVPPAVATFVQTAMSQHQEHLDAWNKVLVSLDQPEVTEPNADLKPTVDEEFGKVTDVVGAAKLALMLEQIAAATYQSAVPVITNKDAITLAGSIQIIDFQHAAILNFVLGNYPVPDTFGKLDMAVAA